jgi:hypothetical protein
MSDIYKEFGVDFLCARYAGPTAAEMKMAQEITRLRARVEELERIRAAADNLFTYDSGWSHWEKKYRELRAALKEAKP